MSAATSLRIAACDLNGQPRGKRLPVSYLDKLGDGTTRMPLSVMNVDIFGADIEDSPLLFETGDADGTLMPTDRGAMPMPWASTPSLWVPMTMEKAGQPFEGDPRRALSRVLERYAARGWTVMAATELEFTLMAPDGQPLGRRPNILSLRTLDRHDAFFSDLYAGADLMDLPAQSAISEAGIGQFEVNLNHQEAIYAADDTWIFRELVNGLAQRHGHSATFMAKPFAEDSGNGLHVHFSILDAEGRNIFDDGGPRGTDTLRHAVAGCLAAMPASTLIFAPFGASYDRFVDGAHAPTAAAWAYENRTAAIRIPGGPPAARRIEHRVAGGDVNPYLLLAAILGAALNGIEAGREPPKPITGNAYDADLPSLAPDWSTAIDRFETSDQIKAIFHPDLIRNLVLTKRQELRKSADMDPDLLRALLLDAL